MFDKFELKAILSANAESLIQGLRSVEAPAKAARKYLTDIGSATGKFAGKFGLGAGLVSGIAAGFGLAKIKSAVHDFAELGDTLERGTAKTGLSASAYQQWSTVAQAVGVDADTLGKAMFKLQAQVGAAAVGANKGFARLMDQSGLAWRKMSGDMNALLPALIDRLERVKNPSQRAALQMKLFGKNAAELAPLFGKGAEGIRQYMAHLAQFKPVKSDAELHKQIEASNQLKLAFFDLGLVTKGYQQIIASKLAPGITAVINAFAPMAADGKRVFSPEVAMIAGAIGDALKTWAQGGGVQRLIATIQTFGTQLKWLLDHVGGIKVALIGLAVIMNAQTLMAFVGLIGAIGRAAAVFAQLARVVLVNPIGLILTAIALTAWLVYQNWDTVKGWFAAFWTWLKAHASIILTCLGPIGWIARTVIEHWDTVKTWFGQFIDWISDKLAWIIDTAKSVGHALGLGVGDVNIKHAIDGPPHGGAAAPAPMPAQASRRESLLPSPQAAARVDGQVNIKIDGLPPGARVEQASGGTVPVNVDAGYSSFAQGMP